MAKDTTMRNLTLVVVSMLAGVLASELAYRAYVVLTYKPETFDADRSFKVVSDTFHVYDREHGYAYHAGADLNQLVIKDRKALSCTPDFYRINAFGSFERDTADYSAAQDHPAHLGPRILVTGASFAAFAQDGETWPSLFSQKIKTLLNSHAQVINISRDGYSLVQMLELAADEITRWHPDLVLIPFTSADLRGDRFWRRTTGKEDRGYTYEAYGPDDDEHAPDSRAYVFFDRRITRQWCETVMNNGGQDPLVDSLADFFARVRHGDMEKAVPRFATPYSFLYNRIRYGEPMPHPLPTVANHPDIKVDAQFRAALRKLDEAGIPFYFVSMPLVPELQRHLRWRLNGEQARFLRELEEATGHKPLSLADYLHLTDDQIRRFPVSDLDGHPSREGMEAIADAMLKLYVGKIIPQQHKKRHPAATAPGLAVPPNPPAP